MGGPLLIDLIARIYGLAVTGPSRKVSTGSVYWKAVIMRGRHMREPLPLQSTVGTLQKHRHLTHLDP